MSMSNVNAKKNRCETMEKPSLQVWLFDHNFRVQGIHRGRSVDGNQGDALSSHFKQYGITRCHRATPAQAEG